MEGICEARSPSCVLAARRAVAEAGEAHGSGGDDVGARQDGTREFDLEKGLAVAW